MFPNNVSILLLGINLLFSKLGGKILTLIVQNSILKFKKNPKEVTFLFYITFQEHVYFKIGLLVNNNLWSQLLITQIWSISTVILPVMFCSTLWGYEMLWFRKYGIAERLVRQQKENRPSIGNQIKSKRKEGGASVSQKKTRCSCIYLLEVTYYMQQLHYITSFIK